MKISVITVVYNNVATIEDAIRSVATQEHLDVEHIVIDGGSTDGTLGVLERHREKLAALVSEPDGGMYDAINKGLRLATGDVVGVLNSDDIYANRHVLGRVAEVFADEAVGACYADLVYVHRTDMNRVTRYWRSCEYEEHLFRRGWMPPHPTFFARRSVFAGAGGFDLEFKLQADFELMLRFLWRHHVRAVYVPSVFVKMRSGGRSSRVVNVLRGNWEAWRACGKNGLAVGPWFIARKVLSRIPQFFRRP